MITLEMAQEIAQAVQKVGVSPSWRCERGGARRDAPRKSHRMAQLQGAERPMSASVLPNAYKASRSNRGRCRAGGQLCAASSCSSTRWRVSRRHRTELRWVGQRLWQKIGFLAGGSRRAMWLARLPRCAVRVDSRSGVELPKRAQEECGAHAPFVETRAPRTQESGSMKLPLSAPFRRQLWGNAVAACARLLRPAVRRAESLCRRRGHPRWPLRQERGRGATDLFGEALGRRRELVKRRSTIRWSC